jgi:cytidine diphosphoramidate kinase
MRGRVIWITGLAGAGKTTVATLVRDRFIGAGTLPVLLDGDRIRRVLPEPLGFAEQDRRRLAMTYARLARELSTQGHLVICATVSLFHTVHAWNRAHLPGYLEVWLHAPLSELRARRDRAELYAAGDVVGVGIAAQFPLAPHLTIDTRTTRPDRAAALIADLVLQEREEPAR